jgi:hypothetical protein
MTADSAPDDFGEAADSFRFVINQTIENIDHSWVPSICIEQRCSKKRNLL